MWPQPARSRQWLRPPRSTALHHRGGQFQSCGEVVAHQAQDLPEHHAVGAVHPMLLGQGRLGRLYTQAGFSPTSGLQVTRKLAIRLAIAMRQRSQLAEQERIHLQRCQDQPRQAELETNLCILGQPQPRWLTQQGKQPRVVIPGGSDCTGKASARWDQGAGFGQVGVGFRCPATSMKRRSVHQAQDSVEDMLILAMHQGEPAGCGRQRVVRLKHGQMTQSSSMKTKRALTSKSEWTATMRLAFSMELLRLTL
mmetsp:Transcript_63821/g.118618  ORF Transcript_63821/g.118618 Transcript_63821/m.118618 type:complete len:252 (+) Transcript_63821:1405-2160(+)